MTRCEANEAIFDTLGVLTIGSQICMRKVGDLIKLILKEAHCARYSMHLIPTKIYHDLSKHF